MLDTLIQYFKSDDQALAVDPPTSQAAVLIAVTREAEPNVILTRRASHMSTHAGEVAFPGGKRDPQDASLLQTALREAEEEIGLSPDAVEVIGSLNPMQSRFGILVTPYVACVSPDVLLSPNLAELDSIFFAPLKFFLDNSPTSRMQVDFFGKKLNIPSYQFGEYTVWGLTAFMVVDLLNRVYDANIDLFVKE